MLNQNDLKEKFQGIKGNFKNLVNKFKTRSSGDYSDQADGVVDTKAENSRGGKFREEYEFEPNEKVGTAPRTKKPILSDGSSDAQKLVWDNEDASMQDKSYSFDEETTDADYDVEDDFEFEDDTDSGSGQESRYR